MLRAIAAAIMLMPAVAHAEGWACIDDRYPSDIQKYRVKGNVLVADDSAFLKMTMPDIDPHSADDNFTIVENNERDLLAVMTSNMAAKAGTYTGQVDRPWMVGIFIDKATGASRVFDAGFDRAATQNMKKGNCTHFD